MADTLELQAEQEYFDKAHERLDTSLAVLKETAAATADNKARNQALKDAEQAEKDAARAYEDGVAIGRFVLDDEHRSDGDEAGRVYLGYVTVFSDGDFPLVVNWQRPVATPYYEASHEDTKGLLSKRTYKCERNKVLDFEEVLFDALARQVADLTAPPELDDALLEDLERHRSGSLQDIVRTIRAAQHRLIRSDLDQLLVVQGGPGTGKSVLALHRVSWLLYNHRDIDGAGTAERVLRPEQVLVVGPNPTFVRYINDLLPSLGDHDVRHTALTRLGAGNVQVTRREADDVQRLKGDLRMRGLLKRGLDDRISVPDESEFTSPRRGRALPRLPLDELRSTIDRLRAQPYNPGRVALRNYLRDVLARRVDAGTLNETVESVLERIWPQLTPASFLQDLLGSEARLVRAAGNDFTAGDVQVLYRRATDRLADEEWSEADVALLDYADLLLNGTSERFRHIVVDEAQDLTPMQLASIARRSERGSMTVLGDLAQSTGPWARNDWNEVIEILRGELPSHVAELEVGYRVPKESFELAARLLPKIAPGVAAPRVVRSGSDPELLPVANSAQQAQTVVDWATDHAGRGEMVGIVCPDEARERLVRELDDRRVKWGDVSAGDLSAGINVVDPRRAKGLEFDAVVVVEPELIVQSDEHGGRLLYVALTRTTSHLAVVHVGSADPVNGTSQDEAPVAATAPEPPATTPSSPGASLPVTSRATTKPAASDQVPRAVRAIAAAMAEELRSTLREDQIPLVLSALEDELRRDPDDE